MIPAESKPDANSSATVTNGMEIGENRREKEKEKYVKMVILWRMVFLPVWMKGGANTLP